MNAQAFTKEAVIYGSLKLFKMDEQVGDGKEFSFQPQLGDPAWAYQEIKGRSRI